MPSQIAQAAALRADGHQMQVYLSKLLGSAVLVGTISADADITSELNLSYTTTSGSSSAVKRGMRVVITSAGGLYKGTLSVRYAGTISSTNLPVREFSSGHVSVVTGDIVTVYNSLVLTDRLVAATETFDPDYETYSTQNGTVKPIPCSGGVWAGNVDSGQTYATITLYGAESYTVDAGSGGSVTHLWTLPTGVAFAPGSADTDTSPTVRADAGYHLIEHTVTDASNSATETQYVPIYVHDATDTPYELETDTISGDPARGFGLTLTLSANNTLALLPDLCPVVVWAREIINGSVQSFGHKVSGRSHILCFGYLRRDTTRADGTGDDGLVEFEIVSPLARLAELPGFSKVMLRDASPDSWSKIESLTVRRAIIQLARYYTNIPQIADFVFDGFDDADYPALYLQKRTPIEQMNELADARGGRIVSDPTGRIEVQGRIDLTLLANRPALTPTFIIADDDLLDIEVEREHVSTIETFRARGFTAATTTAASQEMFAKWAASPGVGSASPITERLIVDSFAHMLQQAAMRGAVEAGVYFDGSSRQYRAPRLTLTLPGSYWGLFRFYREYISTTLNSSSNARGIDLSVFYWMLESVELTFEGGTARVRVVLQAATYAEGAADDTPVGETLPPGEPPVTFPPVVVVPPYDGSGLIPGTPALAMFLSDNKLAYTINPNAGSPAWSTLDLAGLTNWQGGTLCDFGVDPFSSKYLGTGSAVNGWFATDEDIYTIANIGASATITNRHAMIDLGVGRGLALLTERGVQNWVVLTYSGGWGTSLYYSTDGTTFTRLLINGYYDSFGPTFTPGLAMSAHVAGKLYTSAMDSTTNYPDGRFKVSVNYGASVSDLASPAADQNKGNAGCIHVPYASTDMSIIFYGYRGASRSDLRLYRNATDISPVYGGNTYGVRLEGNTNRSVATADDDMNTLIAVLYHPGTDNHGVFLTRNALAASPAWTVLVEPATSMPYRGVYCVGRNAAYLFGVNGAIAYWDGASVRSLKGDLSTTGAVVGICGL